MNARYQLNKTMYRLGKAVGIGLGRIVRNKWVEERAPNARLPIFGLVRGLKESKAGPFYF